NTWPALAIDVETRKPRLSRGSGGFSGPGIHPMVVKLIREVFVNFARDRGVPIVGLGGVLDWEDAAEFVLAGATGIGLGTALFVDPALARKCAKGLQKWVNRQGQPLHALIGAMDEPGDLA
ncbi:MAG: dihydroorotate dehydrogenase, partial [Planctomycetota bacterium]